MSMNAIQFQHGLSLAKFHARYATEQQCEQALVAARWPQGFKCAHCACKRFFLTRNGSGRQLWECFLCGYQSSSIVGTVMEHTKLPLTVWFLAMYPPSTRAASARWRSNATWVCPTRAPGLSSTS